MKKMNATLAISLALLSVSAVAADKASKAPESLIYEAEAVRVAGEVRTCPDGHRATGAGIEKDGCDGAEPVTVERYIELRCPGAKLAAVTPSLTKTDPAGFKSLTLMIEQPEGGCSHSNDPGKVSHKGRQEQTSITM